METKLGGFDAKSVEYTLNKIFKDPTGSQNSLIDNILTIGGDKAKVFLGLVYISKLLEVFLEKNYKGRVRADIKAARNYEHLMLARSDYSYDVLFGIARDINIRSVSPMGGEVHYFESLLVLDKMLARHKKLLDKHFDFIDVDTEGSTATNPVMESRLDNLLGITTQTTQYNFLYDEDVANNDYLATVGENYDVIMEKYQLLLDIKLNKIANKVINKVRL